MFTNYLDSEEFEEEFDLYINLDSPDIEHFIHTDADTLESERCIKVTTMDHTGEPVHSLFNLESLGYLLDSLLYCKKSLTQTLQLNEEIGDGD